jgi:DNA-binding protein H-NS
MAEIPLDGYSVKELQELIGQIEEHMLLREKSDKEALLRNLEAAAAEAGFTLAELVRGGRGGGGASSGGKVPVKFRNPADPSETWTGRGRQPRWLAEKIAQGKQLDSFRI